MNTIQLTLKGKHGPAELDDFSIVVATMKDCLTRVSQAVENTYLDFELVDLSYSSACITIGISDDVFSQSAAEAIAVCRETFSALESGKQTDPRLDYSTLQAFKRMKRIVRKKGSQLTVGGTMLTSKYVANVERLLEPVDSSHGSVTGRLETISIHKKHSCVLYPSLGEEVKCTLSKELFKEVSEYVGRFVTMFGVMHYSPLKMFPIRVDATSCELHPADDELPDLLDWHSKEETEESSVDIVRKMRDEWK